MIQCNTPASTFSGIPKTMIPNPEDTMTELARKDLAEALLVGLELFDAHAFNAKFSHEMFDVIRNHRDSLLATVRRHEREATGRGERIAAHIEFARQEIEDGARPTEGRFQLDPAPAPPLSLDQGVVEKVEAVNDALDTILRIVANCRTNQYQRNDIRNYAAIARERLSALLSYRHPNPDQGRVR